jgi:ParB/RepB/Spo0J family partition protein
MEPNTGKQTKKGAADQGSTEPVAIMVRVDQVFVKQGFNPRTDLGDTAELRANIKLHKRLLNPLTVCPRAKGGGYWLVCGARRLQAIQELKWKEVPVCVIPDLSIEDSRALALAISENSSGEDGLRQELEPIDQAQAFQKLSEQLSAAGEAGDANSVGKMSGCSGKTVRRMLSLLTLSKRVAKMIRGKDISVRAALVVSSLDDPEIKARAEQAIQEGMTEDKVTAIVNDLRRESRKTMDDPAAAPELTGGEAGAEEGSRKNLPKGQLAGTRVLAKGRKEIRHAIDEVASEYLNARAEGGDDELISALSNRLVALLWVVGLVETIDPTTAEFSSTCERLSKELSQVSADPAEAEDDPEDDDPEDPEDDDDDDDDDPEDQEDDDPEDPEDPEGDDDDDDDTPAPRKPVKSGKRGAIGSDDDVEE